MRFTRTEKLTALDAVAGDEFGYPVSIYGNRIVVGAPIESYERGAAYVFRFDDGETPLDPADDLWVQEAKLTTANTDVFWLGHTVSMAKDRVILGAPLDRHAGGNSGAAYVFMRNGTSWGQQAYLKASNPGAGDRFGYSVAVSDSTVLEALR